MSYKLTNKSGGLLVCNLKSGETLRLNNKQVKPIKESEITSHISNLIKQGLILSEKISELNLTKKENILKKKDVGEKEE